MSLPFNTPTPTSPPSTNWKFIMGILLGIIITIILITTLANTVTPSSVQTSQPAPVQKLTPPTPMDSTSVASTQIPPPAPVIPGARIATPVMVSSS